MKVRRADGTGKVLLELGPSDETLLKPLPFQVRRILVPVDFSEASKKALRYAVPFAAAFDSEVAVVHVVRPVSVTPELGYMPPEIAGSQQEIKESVREELRKLCTREVGGQSRFQAEVREGVPWQEIVAAARETGTDLIVLATRGRTGLKHVLLGSVTERVVRHAPCQVLVVRDQERDFVSTLPQKASLSKGDDRKSTKAPGGATPLCGRTEL